MVAKMLGRIMKTGKTSLTHSPRHRNTDALFKDPNKIGSGLSFDEETYKKAIPYFKAGLANFKGAATDIADLVNALIDHLINEGITLPTIRAMKPYLERYVLDLESGKETLDDVSDSNTDLEPNSGNTAPANAMGAEGVPNDRTGNGRRPGSAGEQSAQGGNDGLGNSGVSGPDATPMGEPGNPAVSDGSKPGIQSDANRNDGGSDQDSIFGISPDKDGVEGAVKSTGQNTGRSPAERVVAQEKAENIPVKVNDEQNIRVSLPVLFPSQQDDVIKAEKRLLGDNPNYGMLFTNGTGTGKTFTGLGVLKRFMRTGKTNVLIVTPSQPINNDWIKAADLLGIDVTNLDGVQDAGKGVVITTYANLQANNALIHRDWDLVIADESHKLMSNGDFKETGALNNVRALTRHQRGKWEFTKRRNPEKHAEMARLMAIKGKDAYIVAAMSDLSQEIQDLKKLDDIEFDKGERKPVLFLSATPFAYDKSIDYAEGYLFDYDPVENEKIGDTGYNVA